MGVVWVIFIRDGVVNFVVGAWVLVLVFDLFFIVDDVIVAGVLFDALKMMFLVVVVFVWLVWVLIGFLSVCWVVLEFVVDVIFVGVVEVGVTLFVLGDGVV